LERQECRRLRREEGSRRVGVSVSSVSTWVRDVTLTAEQEAALAARNPVENGLTLDEIQSWWLARLGLPRDCLRTPAVNRLSSASKRLKGKNGTVRLSVHSTFVVQSIYGGIQAHAGIDRPEWLDL
jgi:hypothetical protein